jgi:hypothetical protein
MLKGMDRGMNPKKMILWPNFFKKSPMQNHREGTS